jgi:hypothetical protein
LSQFDGLIWLLVLLGPFFVLQRRLHIEIQATFLLLTRRVDISLALFSILFLPGVLLHEVSHYLTAHMLGVRTGGISLFPRPLDDGRLQMGYVETAKTDVLRDALIGLAPLLAGGIFVAYVGLIRLDLAVLWERIAMGATTDWYQGVVYLVTQPDFWIWFYLLFVVSSTMMPSRSDRRAWLPVLLIGVVILALSLLAGAGPWMLENLAPYVNQALGAVAIVLGISLAVHLVLVVPFYLLRKVLERLTGFRVV